MYWIGNAAKSRIAAVLTAEARARGALTVVDHGCGRLGDWPRLCADCPQISLLAFDPDPVEAAAARKRAAGTAIQVVDAAAFAALQGCADAVVSFSVLEHVKDRLGYLRDCRRLLKPDGVAYLSYDDGHFRGRLENDRFESLVLSLRAWLRNALAGPLAHILGRRAFYQRAVDATALAAEIAAAGLRVRRVSYENLGDFKYLQAALPAGRREEFARFWQETEARLNESFAIEGEPWRGDSQILWRACMTRTLELAPGDQAAASASR
jgi:SAM-dependent methyltransferase